MRLRVDQKTDALYLIIDDSPIVGSEEVSPGIIVDFNDANDVVGIEILNLSKRSETLNLREMVFETA